MRLLFSDFGWHESYVGQTVLATLDLEWRRSTCCIRCPTLIPMPVPTCSPLP